MSVPILSTGVACLLLAGWLLYDVVTACFVGKIATIDFQGRSLATATPEDWPIRYYATLFVRGVILFPLFSIVGISILFPGSIFLSPDERLLAAARGGDIPRLQRALASGAHVDAQPPGGDPALIEASADGQLPVVRALIDAHADVNAWDDQGRTALSNAAANGQFAIVQALLNAGADVNEKTTGGAPRPLAAAAGGGYIRVVQALLDAGADPNADKGSLSALAQAERLEHYDVAKLLRDHGAHE